MRPYSSQQEAKAEQQQVADDYALWAASETALPMLADIGEETGIANPASYVASWHHRSRVAATTAGPTGGRMVVEQFEGLAHAARRAHSHLGEDPYADPDDMDLLLDLADAAARYAQRLAATLDVEEHQRAQEDLTGARMKEVRALESAMEYLVNQGPEFRMDRLGRTYSDRASAGALIRDEMLQVMGELTQLPPESLNLTPDARIEYGHIRGIPLYVGWLDPGTPQAKTVLGFDQLRLLSPASFTATELEGLPPTELMDRIDGKLAPDALERIRDRELAAIDSALAAEAPGESTDVPLLEDQPPAETTHSAQVPPARRPAASQDNPASDSRAEEAAETAAARLPGEATSPDPPAPSADATALTSSPVGLVDSDQTTSEPEEADEYRPWGLGLVQGMALDTEGRKLLPRGTPDPPEFAEPLPAKIKTSHFTESQLVRESLKLDEYLRRWREVELPETPRTKKARDSYVKRAFTLMHRYQDIADEFQARRTQRRLYAEGRPAGPGEVLFGELTPGDRILVEVHGAREPVSCTVKLRSSEGYSVVALDTTAEYLYKNRYEPVRRADATQIIDLRDDRIWTGGWEEEYGLLVRWLQRRPYDAEGRAGVHARAAYVQSMLTNDSTFEGTLVPLPALTTDEQLDLLEAVTPPIEPSPDVQQKGEPAVDAPAHGGRLTPAPGQDEVSGRHFAPQARVYHDGREFWVRAMSEDGLTVHTFEGTDLPTHEVIASKDMPPVTSRDLADGWWEYTYQGRTYTAAKLPDKLTLSSLSTVIVNEDGELIGRVFGRPDTPQIVWAHLHPGVDHPNVARWLSLGRSVSPEYSDEERAFMTAGPPAELRRLDAATDTAALPETVDGPASRIAGDEAQPDAESTSPPGPEPAAGTAAAGDDAAIRASLAPVNVVGAAGIPYQLWGSWIPGDPASVEFHIARRSRGHSGVTELRGTREECLAYIQSEEAVRSAAASWDENDAQRTTARAWLDENRSNLPADSEASQAVTPAPPREERQRDGHSHRETPAPDDLGQGGETRTAPPPEPGLTAHHQSPSQAGGADEGAGPHVTSGDPASGDTSATGTRVITSDGPGEVQVVHGDSVLVRGEHSTRVHPLREVTLPDGSPFRADPDAEKARENAEALAQATTHEGVQLPASDRRLRDLDVEAGHGFIVDHDGNTIGWVRARTGDDGRRYWWGQDADGGAPEDMQWHEDMAPKAGAPPVRAATAVRYGPEGSGVKYTIVTGPDGHRRSVLEQRKLITPDRAITELTLTQAQVRELGKLTLSGQYADGTPIDTLPWDPGHRRYSPYAAQAGALAAAAREAAAEKADLRVKKVLLGAARKMEFQEYDSARRAATIPPPGELDPYAGPYVPNPVDTPRSPGTESSEAGQAIAAAASSEGLALERSDGPPDRLRDLDLQAGHGTLVNSEDTVIGWIRARYDRQRSQRTWWGQPAAGGQPAGFNLLSDDAQAAVLTARTLQRHPSRTLTEEATPQRSIAVEYASRRLSFTSEEVTALQELQLTGTYTDGNTVLPPTWAEPADTHTRTVAQAQTQLNRYDLTVGQQQALARAARSAAGITGDGQEAQEQLLRAIASRLDIEAYETGLHGASLPAPGEPDLYAEFFDPRRSNKTTETGPGPGPQNHDAERRTVGNPAPSEPDQPHDEPTPSGDSEPSRDLNPETPPGADHGLAGPENAPAQPARPQTSPPTQLALVTVAPAPGDQATEAEKRASSTHEGEAALPRYSQERQQALDAIVRGTISMVDGVFMLTNPRRPTQQAPSQKHFRTVLSEGLAHEAGEQVRLSDRGMAWFTHHKLTLPAVPRDVAAVEQAPLPPIDYAPLTALPVPQDLWDGPRPPAPEPLPDNWHKPALHSDEEDIQSTLAMADDAAERKAQSTARDVADLAAGPDHWLWTKQHPLAQYDENAAAALENVTDPRTRDYATRAVLHLRTALEEAGRRATEHYVNNVRSPEWRTTMGKQSDDVHRDRVRGIVITYLLQLRTHASEHELDADTIIHVLEDAAGWTGDLRPLGLKKVAYPHLPAAENVAEAAQHVANSLVTYALGESDTVDTHAERHETWRPVGPHPGPAAPTAAQDPQGKAGGLLTGDETPPGPDAADDVRARFDLRYQVGQFVDYRNTNGETVTARVVTDGSDPVLRDPAGHEFYPDTEFRQDNFIRVLADDGSKLPDPAWTATLPAGHRAVAPSEVKPGDVIHDYRENGRRGTSRLVIKVEERDRVTALTCVGLETASGTWVNYDPRTTAVLDETEHSRELAETALTRPEAHTFAKAFGISLADIHSSSTHAVETSASPQEEDRPGEQAAAEPRTPTSADEPAADPAHMGEDTAPDDTEGEIAAAAARTGHQPADRQEPLPYRAAADQNDHTGKREQPSGPPMTQDQPPTAPISAPVAQGQAHDRPAPTQADDRDRRTDPVPEPAGQGGETGTEAGASETRSVAGIPADRPEPVRAGTQDTPPPKPPAAVREEGTVATTRPSGAATAKPPVVPVPTAPRQQTPLQPAAAYIDAAAFAAGHEALLAELDQHEPWLADTPAAAEAADTLADDSTLGPEALAVLLALQRTLTPTGGEQRPHLVQLLDHHILCAQLAMARDYFGRAARSTHTDQLRELHRPAFRGGFIDFREQTPDGEMELGQYLQHRDRQLTQQRAETRAEEAPAMAEEVVTVAVGALDDDSQLPVFERPGEAVMTAAKASPRLLAHAQAVLASGRTAVEPFAHIHGREVFAVVDQPGTSAASLMLGLTPVDEAGSARAVTVPGDQLTVVAPETLLTAVTTWLNATDTGDRPLLDYAPPATAQTPLPPAPGQGQPTRTKAEETAPATAATSASPSGETHTPRNLQRSSEPAPAAPKPASAPEPAAVAPPMTATPPDTDKNPSPPEAAAMEAQAPPISPSAVPAPSDAATEADRVDQLTALARSVLSDQYRGSAVEATGVLTAPGTVVITLETTGNAGRDREVAGYLRTALSELVRQHPDQRLATYRVDFQHTPQAGQGALGDTVGAHATPVPRERLIAANKAAAKVFAERLRNDPNGELARTYLSGERQLPPEVQQEWILGYAPSDRRAASRGADRWDLLTHALRNEGFTDEELLQAGLAMRSSRGTLIDYFDDRIMFPIHDENGDIVGFTGRRIDRPGETPEQVKERQSQKYFNTSNKAVLFNKSDLVFGLHHPAQAQALAGSNGPAVSCEGPSDVLAVARAAATLPLEQRPVAGAPMSNDITERQLTVLRGLDTDNPRPHIAFLDAGDSGRKVLLSKSNLLLRAPGPTMVTTALGAKDAAELWEDGIKADGDGATPVLRALEQGQPLLDATVEAVLIKNADATERANHAFDSETFFPQTRAIAGQAARYIHESVQLQAPDATSALKVAALTWAKRLHQEWKIPGHMTATAVLLGPGNHSQDYENEVYEQALDLLAADPEGYFANDSHVRSRQSAAEDIPVAPAHPDGTGPLPGPKARGARPGQWPAGTRGGPVTSTGPTSKPGPAPRALALSMVLPGSVDGQPVEYIDRPTAAIALYNAVHERLGRHTAEAPEPDRLSQPLRLGTIHGVELSTSGDDQTAEDPTVVVWLGPARSDSLRLSYSRIVEMTGPELLAAVEWRAAQAAGRLGAPLSQTWRNAVRSILPRALPAQPTPEQLANLLDTIAQGPDAGDERVQHRAERAVALYTAGHPDLALNHLASPDHIWVLRNDGSWTQEETTGTDLSWEELETGFIRRERAELADVAQAAGELPSAGPAPMPADLTVAHHSAHEALEALRPYSIGLPDDVYENITDLVAQMDGAEPALRRLRGPDGEKLMNRARTSFVRILEGLATVASKIRLTNLSTRLERTVARLRGQNLSTFPAARAVRTDRRMQDLAHIERDLERRMAALTVTFAERGDLQEQWIINHARWRARHEQLTGQRLDTDFLPDNGLVAGAPPVPNLIAAHELLLDRLSGRVAHLRGTDQHTGEDSNPYEPTAALLNGVAWAYQQRLVGFVPSGNDPQGAIPATQLRRAALIVTSQQHASPLTLRRAMNVTAERADRLLHRLEEQQILGPYRTDVPRTVLARPADIDALLARPATPPTTRKPAAARAPADPGPDAFDETRIRDVVSKMLAEHHKRGKEHGEPDPAERTAPASRVRKSARKEKEAEANALASGQSPSLTPSQS